MNPHNYLKTLKFYSLFSSTFPSQTNPFIVGNLLTKPSHFLPLPTQILCRHLASNKIPEHLHKITVNYLINSCGFSEEAAISASKSFKLQSPEKADSVLSLLRNHGLSETQISKLVKSRLQVLNIDPETTLLPKLEFFASIGVSRQDLAKTLAYNPHLLTRSLEEVIVPAYDFLRSMLSEETIAATFTRSSWIFTNGYSTNVEPNVGVLREIGMPQSCISLMLAYFPSALARNSDDFREVVDEVRKMGFDVQTSTCVYAIGALCANNRKAIMKRNFEVFTRWGWYEEDVVSAFKKCPNCMVMSEKKIKHVMEFLVKKMGWPSRMIAKCPVVMFYSLGERIIPRCLVVKVLLSKGLINGIENLNLWSVLLPEEKDFLERFVTRYIDEVPQLLSVYQGKVGVEDV